MRSRRVLQVAEVLATGLLLTVSAAAQKPTRPVASAPSEAILAEAESNEDATRAAAKADAQSAAQAPEQPATPVAAPPAAEAVKVSREAKPPVAAEDEGQRDWLAPDSGGAKLGEQAPAGPSAWRIVALLVVVSALVGWAAYARFRKSQSNPARDAKIRVLGSARVGPKAYAVVTAVGNRAFLLGVTDGSVALLSTLEDDDEATVEDEPPRAGRGSDDFHDDATELHAAPRRAVADQEPPRVPAVAARRGAPAPAVARTLGLAETVPAAKAAKRGGFGDLLMGALKKPEAGDEVVPVADPAAQIARLTRDVVQVSEPSRARTKVEGQAAGLAARLQGH